MSITLSGILVDSVGSPLSNADIIIKSKTNTWEVIRGVIGVYKTSDSGSYSFLCPVGNYDVLINQPTNPTAISGCISVYSDSADTTLNDLLQDVNQEMITPAILFEIKQYRDEAVSAKNTAVDAANTSVSARDVSVSAKDEAVSAKNTAVDAANTSVSARDVSVSAKDEAVSAKNTVQQIISDAGEQSTLVVLAQPTGAGKVGFQTLLGISFNLRDYLQEGFIRVKSRDELLSAVNYVNTVVKKATEIRLSRVFEPWTAAQTDLDVTFVSLVGEGGFCKIDASGIANVDGNYFIQLYNSGASNISNLSNIYANKINGIFVLGPGASSNVDCARYNAQTGTIASFTTMNFGSMGFRTGDSYRNNAYIIKHFGRSISRCANLVWMPSGYSNYGEAIEYHGQTLSTASGGIGVQNDNANGAIRFFGGSIDYVGRVAIAMAGRIEFNGTHIEFNNSSNKLNGIPFETSTNETSEIVINGGEILGYINPLPDVVTAIFRCGGNTNGITLSNVKLMKLSMAVGNNYPLNDGTGPFKTDNVRVIDGNGNTGVQMLKGDAQNLIFDPNFTQDNIVDWYISADTGALVSRTQGVNLTLTKDSSIFRATGVASLKVSKIYGIGSAAEIQIRVPIKAGKIAMYELFVKGEGLTGTFFVNAYFASSNYNTSLGVPVTARAVQVGPTRSVAASEMTDWARLAQQGARYYTPEWATHLVIRVQLSSLSAGTINIDDVKVTEL